VKNVKDNTQMWRRVKDKEKVGKLMIKFLEFLQVKV
jgi:hypothetical protein